ncbi:hypothetical protein Cylst_1009 [Cylindrospermum stagnale PCC 7417]|uniref:Uncharacterized protein n=1 Tax=Cylindrospermum stagnale PCC 7417 TaxID=56107 RepID=K9WU45_9NOST|nr:hypothetical protein [Cylindrospermum stagnale]AFZ23329.1 hypothetical protein Cylst_1009 [Cylindrospermum stagnale PCC 7417]
MNRANILTVLSLVALCILSLVYTVTIMTTNRDECSKLEEQAKIDRQKDQALQEQKYQALREQEQKYQTLREQYQQEIKDYDKATQNIEKTIQVLTKSTNQIRGKEGLSPCKVQNGAMVCPDE